MPKERLQYWQDRFQYEFELIGFPYYIIKHFVQERIANERATATSA